MKAALNGPDPDDLVLRDELLHSFHLDADLDYAAGTPPTNHSRLLVHPPGSWAIRPDVGARIPNLVLAGDYVRTHTNLASMEGACEAARRTVNEILQRAGVQEAPAMVWPLIEPTYLERWKQFDARLLAAGKDHIFELLGIRHPGVAAEVLRTSSRSAVSPRWTISSIRHAPQESSRRFARASASQRSMCLGRECGCARGAFIGKRGRDLTSG